MLSQLNRDIFPPGGRSLSHRTGDMSYFLLNWEATVFGPSGLGIVTHVCNSL